MLLRYFLLSLFALLIIGCNKPEPDGIASDGSPIYLSDYSGKWVVVNYWATWCAPCLKELPELNALYEAHKDQLIVLGVSFDTLSDADISTFSKSLQITFPMLSRFNLQYFGIDQIPSLPVTFLISPDRKLKKSLYGPQTQRSLESEFSAHHVLDSKIR